MKIISNFKDYYDSMQQYGKDETIVFPRISQHKLNLDTQDWTIKQLPNELKDEFLNKKLETSSMQSLFDISPVHKQFSNYFKSMDSYYARAPRAILQPIYTVINGQAFRNFLILEREETSFSYKIVKRNPTDQDIFKYLQEHKDFINSYSLKKFQEFDNLEEFAEYSKSSKNKSYSYLKSHNQKPSLSKDDLLKIHEDVKSPIYYIIDGNVITNIPLVYFGLTNLFENTEMLYQEISYCLANVINNKNEPPEQISNDMKIQQHGFDNKLSFRHRNKKV